MTADNTYFDLHNTYLRPSLQIAFAGSPSGKATHFKDEGNRLLLAWNESAGKDFTPFLVPLTAEDSVDVIRAWLENNKNYGSKPDIDGDCSEGQRIYCEGWGHVDHNHYVFVAIEPMWAMYGK